VVAAITSVTAAAALLIKNLNGALPAMTTPVDTDSSSSKPLSSTSALRWIEEHDARLRLDEDVQARRHAVAVEVARTYRKFFLPPLVAIWAGAVALAWRFDHWPEAQAMIIGSTTCVVLIAYRKFCTPHA
jgi:hypothetical protein